MFGQRLAEILESFSELFAMVVYTMLGHMLRKHDELTKKGLENTSTIKIKLKCVGECLSIRVGHFGECGNLYKCGTPRKTWMLHFSLPEIWHCTISLISLFFLNALSK